MKTWDIKVLETVTQLKEYTVEARTRREAERKALAGETVAEALYETESNVVARHLAKD